MAEQNKRLKEIDAPQFEVINTPGEHQPSNTEVSKMKFNKTADVDGNVFLKLPDGGSAKGVFRGEVHEMKVHWVNNKSIACGPDCQPCKNGDRSKFRFRINFVTKEGASYVCKIWEQGRKVYNSLATLAEEYDLEKTLVKITRTGSTANDTVYAVMPLPNGMLSNETEAEIKKLRLHDLVLLTEKPKVVNEDAEDSSIPF